MSISGGPDDSVDLKYISYRAKDGSVVISPTDNIIDAEKLRAVVKDEANGRYVVLQSDFLERATGATVSFFQLRNQLIGPWLKLNLKPMVRDLKTIRLGDVMAYSAEKPYPVAIIGWKGGDAEFALASSGLNTDELLELALKIGK